MDEFGYVKLETDAVPWMRFCGCLILSYVWALVAKAHFV